jgi:hypothetical protein
MVSLSTPAEIVAPTVAGAGPFDTDDIGAYRCPHGHSIGLKVLSELSIDRPSDESDVRFKYLAVHVIESMFWNDAEHS